MAKEENEKFHTKPVSDRVADYLITKIRNKDFQPGEKLPSEDDLAEKLGVSRVAIRESLQKLQVAGIIEKQHGRGSYVNENFSLKILENIIPLILTTADAKILELLEARRFIEIGTAGMAAEKAVNDQCVEIRKLLDDMVQARESNEVEKFSELDLEFHLRIAELSENEVLYTLLRILKELIIEQLHVILEVPGRADMSLKMHKSICEAIENGDRQRAENLMSKHLRNAENDYEENKGQIGKKLSGV